MRIKKKVLQKIISVFASVLLLVNTFTPYLLITPTFSSVRAQEETVTPTETPTPTIEVTPTSEPTLAPTETATPTPTVEAIPTSEPIITPTITPTPVVTSIPNPTKASSQWTFEKVELNKEYISPQNSQVKLTFTRLPDPAGNIKIEEITLTQEQIKQTGSLSDKAYDITSDMKDGDFSYNLSLPIPESSKDKSVEVKFTEDISTIASAEKVENELTKTDASVSVASLDHMTIFIVVYDAVPSVVDTNYPSLGFQATQTSEFGDYIHLSGSTRLLNTVTVTMSNWAKYSDYSSDVRYSGNNVSWSHPITINIYSSELNLDGTPSTKLGTVTQDISVPWRPNGDPTCPDTGYGSGFAWKAGDGACYNGKAFNAVFDMSSLDLILPDDIIVGVAYNTNSWGYSPIGVSGPYESLNVAVPNSQSVSTGSDDSVNEVFWNTVTKAWYTDGGAAGFGIFRKDDNWTPNGTVAFKVETIGQKYINITNPSASEEYGGTSNTVSITVEAKYDPHDVSRVHLRYAPPGQTCKQQYTSPYFNDLGDLSRSGDTFSGSWNVTGLTSGVYKLCSLMHRGSGLPSEGYVTSNSAEISINIDNTAPEKPSGLKRVTPSGLVEYQCGDFTQRQTLIPTWNDLSLSDSSFDHYEYVSFKPDGTIGTEQILYTNKFVHSWVPTEDGTNGYSVRSVDTVGNYSEWSVSGKSLAGSCQITYDSSAPTNPGTPTASVTSPTNQTTITWNWTAATDLISGIKNYFWNLWQGVEKKDSGTTTDTFKTLNLLSYGDGIFTFDVQSEDNAGNVSGVMTSSATTVDTAAPNIPTLNSPIDGYVTKGVAFTQTWNSVTGAILYEYQSCNVDPGDIGETCSSVKYTSTYTGTTKSVGAGQPDSHFWWRVRAKDAAGNWSNWSESREFIIDNTAPIFDSKTIFSGWYKNNQTSTFNYIDSLSGIASGNPVSCVIKIQGSNQTCSVIPNVCDNAGNCNTTSITSNGADIDKTNPNNTWINPINGKFVKGVVNLNVDADDTISGMDSVRFRYGIDTSHLKTLVDDSVTPYEVNWDTTGLNGSYVLRARAQDISGRTNVQDINVIVDNVSPTVSSVSSDGETYNLASGNPEIKITFNEDISVAPNVEVHTISSGQSINDCSDVDAKTYCFSYSLINEELTHTIYISDAKDNAGNQMTLNNSHTFNVDRIAPELSSQTNFEGWYKTNQTSTFTYSDTNGVVSGNDPTCDITTEGINQTCSVTPNACDAAGNCNTTTVTSNGVNIDKTNPSSTILSPANNGTNSVVYSNSWNGYISGDATDVLSDINNVKVSIEKDSSQYFDGTNFVTTGSEILLDATYLSGSWDYTGLATPTQGSYTIRSHAIDNATNMENTYTLTIILDKTIPEVAITLNPSVADAQNGWYKTQPEVTLTATDTNIEKIEYQWNSKTGAWTTYSAPFKPGSEGAHILYYRAQDKAGNYSDVGIKNIKWDQTELTDGPLNLSISPNPTSGTTSVVKWEEANDNTGIDRYEVKWSLKDGNKTYMNAVGNSVREHTIDNLTEGVWNVYVTAFDGSGNSKNASADLTVDQTGPSAPQLSVLGTDIGSVSLGWTKISEANNYIIWYGTTPGSYQYGAKVGDIQNYTVQGLGAGSYYFIVKSVDSSGNQSGNSNEVSTGAIVGAPGVTENTPAEGFAENVLGEATGSANLTPTGTVLGTETKTGNNKKLQWWQWVLLSLFAFGGIYFGYKKWKK